MSECECVSAADPGSAQQSGTQGACQSIDIFAYYCALLLLPQLPLLPRYADGIAFPSLNGLAGERKRQALLPVCLLACSLAFMGVDSRQTFLISSP